MVAASAASEGVLRSIYEGTAMRNYDTLRGRGMRDLASSLIGSPYFSQTRQCVVFHYLRDGAPQEVWLRIDSQVCADTALELFWIAWPALIKRLDSIDPIDGIVMPDFSI